VTKRANLGKPLERAINSQHDTYEALGLASCINIPTPYRVLGRLMGGALKVAYTENGHPDYHVQAGGVSFLFDAKHTDETRWPLKDLPRWQADRLTMHEQHGGYSFVLLDIGSTVYLLPWSLLGVRYRVWMAGIAARGAASLTIPGCWEMGTAIDGVDWLDVGLSCARSANNNNGGTSDVE